MLKKGTKLSEETKRKMSEARKLLWTDPEYKAKLVGRKRAPRSEEWCRKISESKKGVKQTAENIEKRRIGQLKTYEDPAIRQKLTDAQARIWSNPERMQKHLEKLSCEWADPEYRKKQHESRRTAWTPKRKQHHKEVMEIIWSDPDYKNNTIAASFKAISAAPNGIERMVIDICKEHNFPFKFVGGGADGVVLDGRVPDFIRTDGKKQQIIEVFGDYWHDGDTGEYRAKAFASLGYKTLVIWEKELYEDISGVIQKIEGFTRDI